jgi:hypothetical protein
MGPLLVMLLGRQLPAPGAYAFWWTAGELASRALYTSIPVVFGVAGVRWLRARRAAALAQDGRERALLAVLALGALASAFPRADFHHVASVYPLLLLLIFAQRRREGSLLPEAACVGVLLAGTAALSVAFLAHMTYRLELARADLRVSPHASWVESVVRFIEDEVEPGERLFVYGHEAYYYFLSARFSPWPFAQLYPGQLGEGSEGGGRALVDELARRPPALIVRGDAGEPPLPRYAPALFRYVSAYFEPDDRVFARHPPPRGVAPPPALLLVLRPKVARADGR